MPSPPPPWDMPLSLQELDKLNRKAEKARKVRASINKRRAHARKRLPKRDPVGRLLTSTKEQLIGRPKTGHCEVCGCSGRRINFDHCHSTGKARGWICINCNLALGMAKDNPKTLRALADYVENGVVPVITF